MKQSKRGGSGAFLVRTKDGDRYWVKTLNSPQGDRVAVTEQIVGRAGGLIGAPVRPVQVVYIPKALAGWEFRPNKALEGGCGHGSLALADCVEIRGGLPDRQRNENAIRHVGYFALYDWCWGGDVQALLDLNADRALHSHDHGWFLPPTGKGWSVSKLKAECHTAHELAEDGTGLDLVEVQEVADRLMNITRDQLHGVLCSIPAAWPVADEELEAVGAFLEIRAPEVAGRLRSRFGGGAS